MAARSPSRRLWYQALKFLCQLLAIAVFQVRFVDRWRVPSAGGVLVLANHQSHLDPILIGLACSRRLNYLARETLFRFAPLGWLLRSVGTIPIDREGPALSGLKATMGRLKQQEMVLVFPEGTRSRDGAVGELRPGFCTLARRAHVSIVPVAVDGAFQAWPRTRWLPRPAPVVVRFAAAIPAREVARCDDAQLLAVVDQRLRAAHAQACRQRRRIGGSV